MPTATSDSQPTFAELGFDGSNSRPEAKLRLWSLDIVNCMFPPAQPAPLALQLPEPTEEQKTSAFTLRLTSRGLVTGVFPPAHPLPLDDTKAATTPIPRAWRLTPLTLRGSAPCPGAAGTLGECVRERQPATGRVNERASCMWVFHKLAWIHRSRCIPERSRRAPLSPLTSGSAQAISANSNRGSADSSPAPASATPKPPASLIVTK
ncbi:hypothetical protein BDK51DRAFT_43269 [Blyttiomyces helicus]|uniref:Uncharacterized protein n=1 Tax=Blyttiomyces helicus TaxID=388810 RepID=A0A4P9W7E2_9FUNG|nr:hypothetical protein BDK51DRAFT_43269 [Blyttiomyces helicus]|eukprot:RKO86076.1 hypothetical protein BDK51DRAFT_43269 [Blyttiomyces helicus]